MDDFDMRGSGATRVRHFFILALAAVSIVLSGTAFGMDMKYVHTDAQGNVIALTDQNGNIVEEYVYEPYGLPVASVPDGPGYTGHMHDGDTGLIYIQQRYYDPQIEQFLSTDSMGVNTGTAWNFNRYWYANNNPYRFIDPDGRESACLYVSGCSAARAPTATEIAVAETALDFTPGIGDVKGVAEAIQDPTPVNITAAVVGIIPGAGDAVAKALKAGEKIAEASGGAEKVADKAFSSEKAALVDMAKMDKKTGGVSQADMDAYKELNAELPDAFPANQVRGLETHAAGTTAGQAHGHVGPVKHIPEKIEP